MDMVLDLHKIAQDLIARLPELEWKINTLGSSFCTFQLPKNLFTIKDNITGSACIADIRNDICLLLNQQSSRCALFLAQRIKQKINVLVLICHIHPSKESAHEKMNFNLQTLSSRKQWVAECELQIANLQQQKYAIEQRLVRNTQKETAALILSLKAELGTVERQLSIAVESLNQTIF